MTKAIITAVFFTLILAATAVSQEPPQIVTRPVVDAYYGQLYAYDVDAIGDPEPRYELLEYPAGMQIHEIYGTIKWIPDDLGDYRVVVCAYNGVPPPAYQEYTITVRWDWETCVLRADINNDNLVNPMDLIALVSFCWLGGPRPIYAMHCDVNADNAVDPLDVNYLLRYFYMGGPPPVPCP